MPLSMTSPSFMPAMRQPSLRAIRIAEDAHEVVFHRQIEAARARIALAAGTAAQLVVDAARLVALGADDVQAAGRDHLVVARLPVGADARGGDFVEPRFACGRGGRLELGFDVAAEFDVGTAAGHVGGDGDVAGHAGVLDDVRLALVLLGVQHFVRDAVLLEHAGEQLRVSMDVVPTSTGCSRFTQSSMSSMMALNLSFCVR